ncbi:MAG: OmpA family protein, partial [Verrucomicrobiales bacterium]|nr:OmpA family protein [Verrucomicrobiales bacterium]
VKPSGAGDTTNPPSNKPSEFKISKVALPLEIAGYLKGKGPMVANTNPNSPKGTPGSPNAPKGSGGNPGVPPATAVEAADALTVAHAFSKAMIDRNFEMARGLVDSKSVSDERVAALMIAIEEGKFSLKDDKPLIVTLARDSITWVLTRLDSGSASSEFGIEMARADGDGDEWKINGLAFNKLLTTLANQAGAGGVAYAPIVEDPRGGDSLVLYFEFDDEKVTSRSNRQLSIVSAILKQDSDRKIRINGHADALGTDDYNAALSEKRTAAVRKALIAFGISPDQIITEGFGESRPRKPNFNPDGTDNPGGRSQNRRAEVYLDF